MKIFHCMGSAFLFLVAYSSCTKFALDEAEKNVQVIEKIIEDLRDVQPPRLPDKDSPRPYLETNDALEMTSTFLAHALQTSGKVKKRPN